jgi:hypothetical protein
MRILMEIIRYQMYEMIPFSEYEIMLKALLQAFDAFDL